jgi:trans-2-enoyl-CoA reductase
MEERMTFWQKCFCLAKHMRNYNKNMIVYFQEAYKYYPHEFMDLFGLKRNENLDEDEEVNFANASIMPEVMANEPDLAL